MPRRTSSSPVGVRLSRSSVSSALEDMNLNNFPKRLDSKTSCLRITVPENLDLALEGLIRKVLREQPKTDHIHSFAADYFETLLRIRDKAGAKYSSAQLCPFHNDEDAHEMIKLATNFNKPLKSKSKEPPPPKGQGTDVKTPARGTLRPKAKGIAKKEGKQNEQGKQPTPDLIKKLPESRAEQQSTNRTTGEGEGAEESDEVLLTGDPIKELVEKELKMEALARKTETDSLEIQTQNAQDDSPGEQPPENDTKEDSNNREEDKENAEMKEETAEDSLKAKNEEEVTNEEVKSEKEPTETGNDFDDASNAAEKESTEDAEEGNKPTAADIPTAHDSEASGDPTTADKRQTEPERRHIAGISAPETGPVAKEDDSHEQFADGTENTEANTSAETEATKAPIVEDHEPPSANDAQGGTEHVTGPGNVETGNPDSEADAYKQKAGNDQKESENNRTPDDANARSPEQESEPEEKASECSVVDLQEIADSKRESETAVTEDAATEPQKARAAVEEAAKPVDALLENNNEQKISAGQQEEQGEESKGERQDTANEEKPQGGEQTSERSPAAAENTGTEEEAVSAGNENIVAVNAHVDGVPPAEEEASSQSEKLIPVKAEEDCKALEQPKQPEQDDQNRTETDQKPPLDHKDEAAVKEDAETAGLKQSSATAEAETPEDTTHVKVPEKPENPENEQPADELCTVVDIHHIPQQPEDQSRTAEDSQHLIQIQEPEVPDATSATPHPPPQDLQIKTIQAHYYDTLQVPDTVTKELRVHNVADVLPLTTPSAHEPSATDDDAPTPPAPLSETPHTDAASSEGHTADNPPLSAEALNRHDFTPDTRRSETDDLLDLMTPTSGYSLNLSDLSWQTVSAVFLDSERQHSARLSDEPKFAAPKISERTDEPEESRQSADMRPEIEEVFHKTVLPTLVGAVPIPPRDAEEIANTDEKKDEPDANPFGGSSNDRSFDSDTPFISVEVKTVIETQVLDDDDDDEGEGPRLELKVEATVGVEDAEETSAQKEMSDGEQKGEEGSDDRGGPAKGASGESDSTISSAATEIKRVVRGDSGLLTSQSLDLGGRNPLLRTRSLSTFRHGVTDFEVWSAIEKELEEAATVIQARFRRYKARKKLQREDAVQITTEESSPSTTPAEAEERQQSTGEFHDSIVLSDHPR